MKNVVLIVASLVAAFFSNSLLAGTKEIEGAVRVTNLTTEIVYVIVNPSAAAKNAENLQEFIDAGGKVLDPGESAGFVAKVGFATVAGITETAATPRFVAIAADPTAAPLGDSFSTSDVVVKQGQVTNISFADLVAPGP